MNRFLFAAAVFFFSAGFLRAQKIEFTASYQGANIVVQNPFAASGVGFCVQKVVINGKEVSFDNSGTFEIQLNAMNFKMGDSVHVLIQHSAGCTPRIIGKTVCYPKSYFNTISITTDGEGNLKWKVKDETIRQPFVIEQFRWKKWVKIGEVMGQGGTRENEYAFKVAPHSGENTVRVKQDDCAGMPRTTASVKFTSAVNSVSVASALVKKDIQLSGATQYELFDPFGMIIKKGFGRSIDCSSLKKGVYYLNYDNSSVEITKQ